MKQKLNLVIRNISKPSPKKQDDMDDAARKWLKHPKIRAKHLAMAISKFNHLKDVPDYLHDEMDQITRDLINLKCKDNIREYTTD